MTKLGGIDSFLSIPGSPLSPADKIITYLKSVQGRRAGMTMLGGIDSFLSIPGSRSRLLIKLSHVEKVFKAGGWG